MAGPADNNGAFDLVICKVRRGTEPPPHIHVREDEFFYVLSGEVWAYVESEVFAVRAGECMVLPRRRPHAWLITSEEAHLILLVVPGGFLDAINKMNAPAERMQVPTDPDTVTYANVDLTETAKVFGQHGIRFLTADEIGTEMPQYPRGPRFSEARANCRSPGRARTRSGLAHGSSGGSNGDAQCGGRHPGSGLFPLVR
jgi:quercetin dioxygenase-like cupin family protein